MLRATRPLTGTSTLCKICLEEKDDSLFVYKHGKRVGLVCRSCNGKICSDWNKANPEAAAKAAANYRALNPDYPGRWLKNNPGAGARLQSRYRKRHPDRIAAQYQRQISLDPNFAKNRSAKQRADDPVGTLQYYREWRNNNRDKTRFYSKTRRSIQRKQTPPWANDEETLAFYRACPDGYEVDHIIPLRGKRVSGLHVVGNLQYLTPTQNRRKQATFID